MCGIAGAIDLRGERPFSAERLGRMCAAMGHRGPDGEHHHCEPGLAMGARRLALVDIAGGTQPLANEDGSVWVAFNGELYDHERDPRETINRAGDPEQAETLQTLSARLNEHIPPGPVWE